jgi:ABC-type transporter Mla subunit MlaD
MVERTPESVRELNEQLDKMERLLAKSGRTEKQVHSAMIKNLEEAQSLLEKSNEKIEARIEAAEAQATMLEGTEKRIQEARAETLRMLLEEREEDLDSLTDTIDKRLDELDRFSNAFNRIKDKMTDAFRSVDDQAIKAAGSALGLSALFGVEMPKIGKLFSEYAVSLDDARRSIVPFTTSISDANTLQEKFRETADKTKIPITQLGESVGPAAGEFRLFALETEKSQAALVGFQAQMKSMGGGSGALIAESIMTEGSISSAEQSINMFKALSVQMKDLGVMPQVLSENYNKLIGTFGMFGDSATINIARTSLAATKAKVDVGAITGFGENFSGYSQAASTAQQINAIFGRRIIDNPAELVSIFYTGGGEAALEYVKRKLVTSGVNLEEMLGGAAGAARLRMLGGMGFGDAKSARRALLGDTTISAGEQSSLVDAMEKGKTGEGKDELTTRFDDIAREMLTQAVRVQQMNEEVTADFFSSLGVGLDKFGLMFDGMLTEVDGAFGRINEKFKELAKGQVPGLGGLNDDGVPTSQSLQGLIKSLIPQQDKELESLTLNTTSLDDATTAINRLTDQLETMDGFSPATIAGGTDVAGAARTSMLENAGFPSNTKIVLQVAGKDMDAHIFSSIDKRSKGATT